MELRVQIEYEMNTFEVVSKPFAKKLTETRLMWCGHIMWRGNNYIVYTDSSLPEGNKSGQTQFMSCTHIPT